MASKRYLSYYIIVLAVMASVVCVYFIVHPEQQKVIDAETVQNLKLVTFSDGTTRVLFHDYDYSKPDNGWDLALTIPAAEGDGRQLPPFTAPHFTFQGSNSQREVYTYNYVDDGCDNKILYINRIAKSAEKMKLIDVPYCIRQTLDTRDFTHFFATSEDGNTVALGTYEDGKILASANPYSSVTETVLMGFYDNNAPKSYLPPPTAGWVTSNWENTKFAFISGVCDIENDDTLKFIVWDTIKGTVTNKRASLGIENCGQASELAFAYDHDNDAFDICKLVQGQNQFRYIFSIR